MVAGLSMTAQAAEPTGTLTLACEGTSTETSPHVLGSQRGADAERISISIGIIVDFAARTVTGFPLPPVLDRPAVIRDVTETTISFTSSFTNTTPSGLILTYSFDGTIDRVTGAVEAGFMSTTRDGPTWTRSYSLKCKPTQRMF